MAVSGEHVLVLRALGLGDAVSGIAALRGVRRAWPAGTLVLAAPASVGGWLRGLGIVDAVLDTPGLVGHLAWPPELAGHVAVNLHGSGPESHRLLQGTRPGRLVAFRCPAAGHEGGPRWSEDEHEVDRWCRLVTDAGGRCGRDDLRLPRLGPPHDCVVIHPGAASASRRWPVDRWRSVAAALAARGVPVVVTGTRDERTTCAHVAGAHPGVRDLSGKLSLPALADLVAGAPLLVSGDTGPAHLATAYGTPSVLLFGPVAPARWGPVIDPERHVVLWRPAAGTPHSGDPHGAALDPALAAISVDDVLGGVDAVLPSRLAPSRRS